MHVISEVFGFAIGAIVLLSFFYWWTFGGSGGYKPDRTIYRCRAGHAHPSRAAMHRCPDGENRGYYCLGTGYGLAPRHYHKDGGDQDRCTAGLPPPVPVGQRPAACPQCRKNHFEEACPGYRVTDGRTGEVVGYWEPKDAA